MLNEKLYIVDADLASYPDGWGTVSTWYHHPSPVIPCSNSSCYSRMNHICIADLAACGSDYFLNIDRNRRMFIPGDKDFPFIFCIEHVDLLDGLLTGTQTVRIGYEDWNQELIPEGTDPFNMTPVLRCLLPTSCCDGLINLKEPIRQCPVCKSFFPGVFEKEKANLRILKSHWDGSDVFLIPGVMGTFITETGKRKLDEIGFTNLKYTEVYWG